MAAFWLFWNCIAELMAVDLRVSPTGTAGASGASVHRKIDRAKMRFGAAAFKGPITFDSAYPIGPSAQQMGLEKKGRELAAVQEHG